MMVDLLKYLAGRYTHVIVDTPPLLPVTDASILAPVVDAYVIVVKLGTTTDDRVKRAIAALDRVNGHVVGVVPNQSTLGTDRDYRYPYKYSSARIHGGSDVTPRIEQADLREEH
jgi:Mrp family chromosome partitioning ATPase